MATNGQGGTWLNNVSALCYNSINKKEKEIKMSKSLITKLYKGCLFIHNGENFLINEVRELDDEKEIISVWLTDSEADFTIFTDSYSEFLSKVVK